MWAKLLQLPRQALAFSIICLVFTLVLEPTLSSPAYAQDITSRSVAISSAQASASNTHKLTFTYPSTNNVGSVVFEYCDNSPLIDQPCNAPVGLNVAAATLVSQTGNTGFSIDGADTTANRLVIARPAAAGIITSSSYQFTNVTNPSSSGQTFYIRITTHAASDGSGAAIDNGSVAFATLNIFNVGANVPPFLSLCVGITVAPNCSAALGDSVNLGILSSSNVSAGQSQFAIGTNSDSGYNVFALGTTMTSGNNVIPALSSPSLSIQGSNQFGINLRGNSFPTVGQEPSGAGTGSPTPDYSIPNFFVYRPGDAIANSSLPTDYNVLTVSYMVNVSSGQPPGVYSTTFTYLGTAQF